MNKKLAIMLLSGLLVLGLAVGVTGQDKKSGGKKSAAGDATKGEAVFKDKNCGVCHWPDKDTKRIGPGLKGLFKHEKMWNDKPFSEAAVREMILKGGGKMTGFEDQMTAGELNDLVAYLKTL
jgi:cytochrome c